MPNTIIIGSGSYIPKKVIGREHFMDSVFYTDEHGKIDKPKPQLIQTCHKNTQH